MLTVNKPIAPTPEIDSLQVNGRDILITYVWKDGIKKLDTLLKSKCSVDVVCQKLVQYCSVHAAELMNEKVSQKQFDPKKFFCKSYQNVSGAFIFSMGYDPHPHLFNVRVRFKVTPGVCRKCGIKSETVRDILTWTETDLCFECDTPKGF